MIGEEIRATVFRDTNTQYNDIAFGSPSYALLKFARRHAGPQVLDLGCASGNYCLQLSREAYRVFGADVNERYVEIARQRGVDARLIEDGRVPLEDGAVDTVLLFEVLEHVPDPRAVLREARRLARKNVLVTVPNCEHIDELQQSGLLFEHFGDLDHRNFYTQASLHAVMADVFRSVTVTRGDPINPIALLQNRRVRRLAEYGMKLRVLKPHFFFRLYAVATV